MHSSVSLLTFILSCTLVINSLEIRSSTQCTVVPCSPSLLFDCASDKALCFNFRTINGTNLCAPASSCDLLETCDQNGECLSKTSVCVINSCCPQPVCLPLLLTELCASKSLKTATTSSPPTIRLTTQTTEQTILSFEEDKPKRDLLTAIIHAKICPKATWNQTSTIVASFSDINPQDFSINHFDDIYIPDDINHTIRKYESRNSTHWSKPLGSTYLSQPTAIFVDLNDNIYVWDSQSYEISFWSSANRSLQALLSFDRCKHSIQFNQICYVKSIIVDENRTIYISESSKTHLHTNRVMKFEANTTIGQVIAGTSRSGSAANQLNLPDRIYLDSNRNLYVADMNNSRIQLFYPGNRYGKTLVSIKDLTDFSMDTNGDIYVLIKSENTIKRLRQTSMYGTKEDVITSLHQPIRMQFGFDGSIYVLNQEKKSIEKFQIINNHC